MTRSLSQMHIVSWHLEGVTLFYSRMAFLLHVSIGNVWKFPSLHILAFSVVMLLLLFCSNKYSVKTSHGLFGIYLIIINIKPPLYIPRLSPHCIQWDASPRLCSFLCLNCLLFFPFLKKKYFLLYVCFQGWPITIGQLIGVISPRQAPPLHQEFSSVAYRLLV